VSANRSSGARGFIPVVTPPLLVDKANHTIGAIRYALLPLYRKCTTGMLEYYREQYEAARAAHEGIG
jgi:hypothetical protein